MWNGCNSLSFNNRSELLLFQLHVGKKKVSQLFWFYSLQLFPSPKKTKSTEYELQLFLWYSFARAEPFVMTTFASGVHTIEPISPVVASRGRQLAEARPLGRLRRPPLP